MQIKKEYVGFNQSQIKVLFETITATIDCVLSNYDEMELSYLRSCIASLPVYTLKDLVERLHIGSLIAITHTKSYDETVEQAAGALIECIGQNSLDFSNTSLEILLKDPNTNPFNLLAMQDFAESLSASKDIALNLYRLREMFLEMTPFSDHDMGTVHINGQDIPICKRIGKVPMNLDQFGVRPPRGDISDILTKIIEHTIDFVNINNERMQNINAKNEKEIRDLRKQLHLRDQLIERLSQDYTKMKSLYQGDNFFSDDIILLLKQRVVSNAIEFLGSFSLPRDANFLLQEIADFELRRSFCKRNKLPLVENVVAILEESHFYRSALLLTYRNDLNDTHQIIYFDPMGFRIPAKLKSLFPTKSIDQILFPYQIASVNKDILLLEGILFFLQHGELPIAINFEALRKGFKNLLLELQKPNRFSVSHLEKFISSANTNTNSNSNSQVRLFSPQETIDIDTNYCYDDRDINIVTATYIQRYLGGMVKNHRYLLNNYFFENRGTIEYKYRVAVTPAVSTQDCNMSVGYFLDASLQPGNILGQCLTAIINANLLTPLQTLEKRGREQLIRSTLAKHKVDAQLITIIRESLEKCYFSVDLTNQYILELEKDNTKKDVFEEIMPLFKNELQDIKITFAYNDKTRFHWLLVEILLHVSEPSRYLVQIFTHDPRGAGIMSDEDFNTLQTIIIDKIQSYDISAKVEVLNQQSSYTARQGYEDYTDCGVILCDDQLKCIQGESLSLPKPYPVGAKELRLHHFELVKEYSSTLERVNFLKRVVRHKQSLQPIFHHNEGLHSLNKVSEPHQFVLPKFICDILSTSEESECYELDKFQEWLNATAILAVKECNNDIIKFLVTTRAFLEIPLIEDWQQFEKLKKACWKEEFLANALNCQQNIFRSYTYCEINLIRKVLLTMNKEIYRLYMNKITEYKEFLLYQANVVVVDGKPIFIRNVDNSYDANAAQEALDDYKSFLDKLLPLCALDTTQFKDGWSFYNDLIRKVDKQNSQRSLARLEFDTFKRKFDEKRKEITYAYLTQKRQKAIALIEAGFLAIPKMTRYNDNDPLWSFIIEKYLVKASVSVATCDADQNTLLHLAVKHGHHELALYFLQVEPEVLKKKNKRTLTPYQVRDPHYNTLLHYCLREANHKPSLLSKLSRMRFLDFAYQLINLGADVSAQNVAGIKAVDVEDHHGDTILHHAVRDELCQLGAHLLSHQASLVKVNKRGETPWDIIFAIKDASVKDSFIRMAIVSVLYKSSAIQTDDHNQVRESNENKRWSTFQKDVFLELEHHLNELAELKNRSWFIKLIDYARGLTEEAIAQHKYYIHMLQKILVHAHLTENDSGLVHRIDASTSITDYKFLNLQTVLVRLAKQAKLNPQYALFKEKENNRVNREARNVMSEFESDGTLNNLVEQEKGNEESVTMLSNQSKHSKNGDDEDKLSLELSSFSSTKQ